MSKKLDEDCEKNQDCETKICYNKTCINKEDQKILNSKNNYEILGLDSNASESDIKKKGEN